MTSLVRKRRVYLLAGYEPLDPAAHRHRFDREIRRFEKTWSVTAEVGPLVQLDDSVASWQVAAAGPDWRTEADIRLLRWDDIAAEDAGLSMPARLLLFGRAALDILLSGTFFRYVRAYWRYALFAAYPSALLFGFTLAGLLAAALWTRAGGPAPAIVAPVLAVAVFLALLRWPGRSIHIDYMLNDWIFACDMIWRRRPSIEARAARFAEEIAAGVRAGDVDEVVVVAHSLGAVWMVDAVSRALDLAPELAGGPPLGLAGVGSSTLKVALHPRAAWLREAVRRVADEPRIVWAEYDSHVDFICFYKNNTVEALGLKARSRPVSLTIRLSRMLAPETWGRFRGNLLRVHRQYVMGNERRYAYDFHMIACGPFPFSQIVRDGEGLPTALAGDGSLAAGKAGAAARSVAS